MVKSEEEKINRVEKSINKMLMPLQKCYHLVQDLAKKTHKKMPYVYEQVDALIKSHLVTLEKDKRLLHDPDFNSFARVITNNIVQKLPNLDEEELNEIVSDTSSNSFLDMLTRGLGGVERGKDYTVLNKRKKFKRILIANRGEIALRIIRACRELGIEAVVVYSEADKDSLAVKFADKAYCIGSSTSAKSYLDINKIIKIAKKAGADAIHPGYGFLAENAEFADLCLKNKIKFIGPTAKAIKIMGNKSLAREVVFDQGIPLIPGTKKIIKDEAGAVSIAKEIGYPIMLKAAAGGGGKGMRIVRNEKELYHSFKSAQNEAKASFNNPDIYIEKLIEGPRHIEFQVLADKYGRVIHLGERECSIQRRHQKLIEEAPSTALDDDLRRQMGEASLKAAKAVGYEGAGTVEFLLDKNNNIYFMEMNTRIQVEHGITEMVTGVDLVKEQIKIAAGAKLAYKQRDIKIDGWAIECRINAESPFEDFAPSTGTIVNYLPPGGPGIRVCSSCHAGHVISPYYDSMIAKLMCKGTNREEAIERMRRALNEFIVAGVETTIPFHKLIFESKKFIEGNITTSFIEENKIMEELKRTKKNGYKRLTKKEKVIIVSTAVTKYMENRTNNKPSNWAKVGREELMENNM